MRRGARDTLPQPRRQASSPTALRSGPGSYCLAHETFFIFEGTDLTRKRQPTAKGRRGTGRTKTQGRETTQDRDRDRQDLDVQEAEQDGQRGFLQAADSRSSA